MADLEQVTRVERLAYSDKDLDAAGILSRKTRYRGRRAGTFPEPVAAGGRKLYRAVDIHLWLEDPVAWALANKRRAANARSTG